MYSTKKAKEIAQGGHAFIIYNDEFKSKLN